MFHLNVNPSPPTYVGRLTMGHAVLSSAIMMTPGLLVVNEFVQLAQECDGFEILAAAETIRHPFALLLRL